ncbi:MAG: flagellar motor switch protein FliG [Terriglobia bacterium]|jgi:flagellar motor switch protein FliG
MTEAVQPAKTAAEGSNLPGLRKAAILLVLLGDEAASMVYRNLPQEEIQLLTEEISELEYISPQIAGTVLEEFYRLTVTQEYLAQGGSEYARQLLVKAFGEDGAKNLLDQVMHYQEARATTLDSLKKADPQQLVMFVEGEHPQTIALVLAHMGLKSASTLLLLLPEKTRAEVIRRLAEMHQFSPEMVQKISLVLNRKLKALGEQNRRAYGGIKAVGDMLNRLEPAVAKTILETIEQDDPKLALNIRNLMFTFEDLLSVPESTIRELLSQLDKKTLGLALKGSSEEIRNHFFKTMSSRAAQMLSEDMEALGPVRARQVTQAQQEIVQQARKLEADGKLTLKSFGDDAYVV